MISRFRNPATRIRYKIVGWMENILSKQTRRINPKTMIIIRLDEIGDYVLYRNFIRKIKESEKYKEYSITLCGNILWKDLAENFDSDIIDKFIWIDKKRFWEKRNLFYRYIKLFEIHKKGFERLIQPNDTRSRYTDYIVQNSGAKFRIGVTQKSEFFLEQKEYKVQDVLDARIDVPANIIFQFDRNKYFTEKLIGEKLNLQSPDFRLDKDKLRKENYIAIFPGAGEKRRKWSEENFAELCKRLNKHMGSRFIICGGRNDRAAAKKIIETSGISEIEDYTGRRLDELIKIISNADMLISNETCAVHIGAAVNTKTICISNGKHFGRFNPYPEKYQETIKTIYTPEIKNKIRDTDYLVRKYHKQSSQDINSISVDEVLSETLGLLFQTGETIFEYYGESAI